MPRDLFDHEMIPRTLEDHLRSMNPWWAGKPGPVLPPFRRWAFRAALKKIESGLAPITVLRGPRQVGKTTLQQQIIEHFRTDGGVDARRILRVQFDEISSFKGLSDPVLSISRWFETRILGRTLNEAARAGEPAFLFFDEAQNLQDWAPQLKALVDHNTVHALVTGSSALRIEAGRDSLAGRITQIDLGALLLREIAGLRFGQFPEPLLPHNGLEPLLRRDFWISAREYGEKHAELIDRSFLAYSERGGYPVAQARSGVPWPEIADQLNETVIQRAIQHDLRMGSRGIRRDAQLLEEVFRLACRYAGQAPGQAVFVPEIQQALRANVGWQRILAYLKFLDGALLIRLIPPLEMRLKRRKGNAKICLCDHALRAAWLQEYIPIHPDELARSPHLHELAGRMAESLLGYFLSGIPHLDVAHFPQRGAEPEVDFILTIGERRIPVEIKYRTRVDPLRDTLGLRAFLEKAVNNAPFGLLVTMDRETEIPDPRILSIPLSTLLFLR